MESLGDQLSKDNGGPSEPYPDSSQAEEHVEDSLHVVDKRTGLSYSIPIAQNSIQATDFHQIKSPRNAENPVEQNNAGIRIYDPGFQNTACMQSEITYVDGDVGEIAYRGIPVTELFYSGRPFEHVAFLLIFGYLPPESEAKAFNYSIANAEMPPQTIFDMINSLPYVKCQIWNHELHETELTFQDSTHTPQQPLVPPSRLQYLYVPRRSQHIAAKTSTREMLPP